MAEEGTFGRAAVRLGFTQSAVSQQIAALERLADVALFDRPKGPRPAQLTPAGELLLGHARAVLARLDVAADELQRLSRGEGGRLVIGTLQSVSAKVLPEVVGRRRRDRPELEIRLHEVDDPDVLLRCLRDNELDLAFLIDDESGPGLDITFLASDPYVLVVPAGDGRRTGPNRWALSTPPRSSASPNAGSVRCWSTGRWPTMACSPSGCSARWTTAPCRPWCGQAWGGR